MQALTIRGIKLANELKKHNIEVIESFPGAAQDILQIPRKKTSLEELKQGLIDFGITGDFKDKIISHDELDAITSALVGYFYLSNHYEALGNKDEDYLIIPSLSKINGQKKLLEFLAK
jgi:predicted nuclease with RNAse H fold